MALSLYIAGVDRTEWLKAGSCTVSRPLGGRASCSAVLEDRGRGYTPTLNAEFIIYDGATKRFAGKIRSIVTRCHPDGAHLKKQYTLRVLDYASIFDRRRTSYYSYFASPPWTMQDIVLDLIERHADLEGVTAPGLPTGPSFLEPITANYNSLTEMFNKISAATASYGDQFLWNIDFDKVLSYSQFASNPAPFSLTDTSNNFLDFEIETTLDNYRNVQHVRTEHEIDAVFTQSFTGNGSRTTFHTHHAIRATPTVTVNGVSKTIGEQGVDETGKDFYWRRDEDGVFNQDHATLTGSQVLAVTYLPTPRNIATADDQAQMDLYGQFEAVDEQRNITDFDEAGVRAEGGIEQFGTVPTKIRFKTRAAGLEPGQRITINLTRHGINDEYLIEDLGFQWIPARSSFLFYTVRCTSLDKASPAKTSWMEKLVEMARIGSPPETILGVGRPRSRTLLLKDTAIGTDIADHVTVYADGVGRRIVGVLRLAITSDLTVRVKKNGTTLITLTIPDTTPIDTPVESTAFTDTPQAFADGEVLTWDVLASDGQVDAAGVAAFTLEWTAS